MTLSSEPSPVISIPSTLAIEARQSKHILLYTDDFALGGVTAYNDTILGAFARLQYKVTCVHARVTDAECRKYNPWIDLQKQLGVRHVWAETSQSVEANLWNFSIPRKIFLSAKPDLVIFCNGHPFANTAAKQVATELGIPFIAIEHSVSLATALNLSAPIDELILHYQNAMAVVAVSEENLRLLREFYGLPEDKGQVIHYGRPESYFAAIDASVRNQLRQEFGIPSDAVVCFTAARLEKRKGYQYQLQAIEQLVGRPIWSKLYFVWAGSGELKVQIQEGEIVNLAEALSHFGIADRVKSLGNRYDIADWLDACDIFVLPSEHEGMPLSIMEAMAKGLPVIASAVSGIPEELGNTGKLLPDPNFDPDAAARELAETVAVWAEDANLRCEIGQACKKRAEVMFRADRMIKEAIAVVEKILATIEKPIPDGHPIQLDKQVGSKESQDYISPGFAIVRPDAAFPNMIIGNTDDCQWQYLRREVPHNWYVDKRKPDVGFLNRDEAHILYNTALQFQGKRALEVGCWLGWSACHLALAGVELDVVDPLLGRPEFHKSVSSSLKAAGVIDSVNLVSGYSPQKVEEIAAQLQRKWSLIFIDGNHDAPSPLHDAIACEKYAEADAIILFHDLASPQVSQGLDYLRDRGWKTTIYQTMQIMGVAWRGNVTPVKHIPDPRIDWQLPQHLQHFVVSGLSQDPDRSEFEEILAVIRPFTLLNEARLFSLYSLARQVCLKDLPGNFVECGTYKGGSAALLAAVIKRYSKRPRSLYAFDTFEGMPDPTAVDRHEGLHANEVGFGKGTLKAPIRENLDRVCQLLGVSDIVIPIRGLFAQTLPEHKAQIGSIAFLHADGDWYESTRDIFNNLYDNVVGKGIVQIDDYGYWEGCQRAVCDFQQKHGISFELNRIDETGVWFQKNSASLMQQRIRWNTALPNETLLSIQNASFKYSWKGIPTIKNPFDFALYPLLLWHLKPNTIIEIGSCNGGSAIWLADLLTAFGIEGHVYSIDINKVTSVMHPRVTFLEGDQTALHKVLSQDFLNSLKRPLLVIEDGAHFYQTTLDVLNFFHPYLRKDEYIIVEDGIISDLGADSSYNGGPKRALQEFLSKHDREYIIDTNYCDFFGHNLTWNTNGYLKKVNDSFDLQQSDRESPKTRDLPLISVVIPCYNRAEFLSEAIDSVINQTCKDWEIIVVNDGSTDSTSEVVSSAMAVNPDKKIRIIEKANGGVASARNAGIAVARGEYVMALDADDKLTPNALKCLLEKCLEQKSTPNVAFGSYKMFGIDDRTRVCIHEYSLKNIKRFNMLHLSSMYTKSVWEITGGYKEKTVEGYEDWEFWVNCHRLNIPFHGTREIVVEHRISSDSMLRKPRRKHPQLMAAMVCHNRTLFSNQIVKNAEWILNFSQLPIPSPKVETSLFSSLPEFTNQLFGCLTLYEIDPNDRSVLKELRKLRQQFAEFLLAVASDSLTDAPKNLEDLLPGQLGECYESLVKCGIISESLMEGEQAFLDKLANQLSHGSDRASYPNYLLVALLYYPSDRLPMQYGQIPRWLEKMLNLSKTDPTQFSS